MKLPNLAIIFIIIVLPLSVVLSTYMQLQIDVLNAKENYSTKLLDATYDGILSFELNTLSIENIEGASVKSHVSDAVSTFFTTMSINMGESGATRTNIQSYVPAILFTTYDGYYIYSPVKTSQVAIGEAGIATFDEDYGELIYEMKDGVIDHTNGTGYTTEDVSKKTTYDLSDAKIDYNYMVKPFVYYSATYCSDDTNKLSNVNFNSDGDYVLTVNYSLDNHVALYGRYRTGGEARTISKSGYLINLNNTKVEISDTSKFYMLGALAENKHGADTQVALPVQYNSLGEDDWTTLIECYEANYQNGAVAVSKPDIDIYSDEYEEGYFMHGGTKYLIRGSTVSNGYTYKANKYTTMNEVQNKDQGGEAIIDYTLRLEQENNTEYIDISVNGCKITEPSAKAYYLKAYFFSRWVEREFGDDGVEVKLSDICTTYDNGDDELWVESQLLVNGQGIEDYVGDELLFTLEDSAQDPEKDDSIFTQHKRQVIQNSIQYNLNSAISTYNDYYIGAIDFSMPAFNSSDWNKILTKVSMATFMQGVPCGDSTWGDYAIATSTNNKVFVNKNNLYFISDIDKKNDLNSYYHSIDCLELKNEIVDAGGTTTAYAEMSHEYTYDAENETPYLCVMNEGAGKYKKYYYLKGIWYYWNGLKVPDTYTTLLDNLNNNKIPVASAYVELKSGPTYMRKKLMYCLPNPDYDPTLGSGYPYLFFEYGTHDADGYLIQIENSELTHTNYNPVDDSVDSSYEPQVSESVILYDHMNVDCYWCMMSANYDSFDFAEDYEADGIWNESANKVIATAWYTYIGKYRNDQFKMTDSIQR